MMPPRSLVHPRGQFHGRKHQESVRLRARRDQESRVTICPDCGRLRTNIKRHRGSKLCLTPRATT